MHKVIAILQARTDSTRLPGKVLLKILNKPMLLHQIQRLSRSQKLTKLIVATSDQQSDDQLSFMLSHHNIECFRGDKDNVLKRFYDLCQTLKLHDQDIIVRLTGDCPLHDAHIVDELIDFFESAQVDYAANCIQPIYPDGFDVEVFTFKALQYAYHHATKPSQKEHVTPYIRDCGILKIAHLSQESTYSHLRLTVDEADDFKLINLIYTYFGHNHFTYAEIIRFLEINPELQKLNEYIKRNEGYVKSLSLDTKAPYESSE